MGVSDVIRDPAIQNRSTIKVFVNNKMSGGDVNGACKKADI